MQNKRLNEKPLGKLLIEKGLIEQEHLDKALHVQKSKKGLLGQTMISLGYVTEKDIAQVITVQYGFPYLPLSNYEIDEKIVKMVPEEIARKYKLVPFLGAALPHDTSRGQRVPQKEALIPPQEQRRFCPSAASSCPSCFAIQSFPPSGACSQL